MEIIRGHIYRAKRPKPAGNLFASVFNDRVVVYINPLSGQVQYDSPTVRHGGKFPTIDRDKFEAWAGSDVTEGYVVEGWAPFVEKRIVA